MSLTENHSDSDRTCVIIADMDKDASGAVDFRSPEIAHEFNGHVGAFTCAQHVFTKNGSNRHGPIESGIRVTMTRALIETRHATFDSARSVRHKKIFKSILHSFLSSILDRSVVVSQNHSVIIVCDSDCLHSVIHVIRSTNSE